MIEVERSVKRLLVATVDLALCVVATWLSFSIRLGYWQLGTAPVLTVIVFEAIAFLAIFTWAGVYNNVFRFHGPKGLAQLALCCLYLMVPSIVVFGLISFPGIPRTISILFPLVFFALVALTRILARFALVDLLGAQNEGCRVLIYGVGPAGRQLAASLDYEPDYRLVGYIDDEPHLAGQSIEGAAVYQAADLEEVIEAKRIDIVLLAIPELGRSARAAIAARLQSTDVDVRTLPNVGQIVDGKVAVSDLREIAVSDLLSRDTVEPDVELLARIIEGRTVLVTGAGGSIGSELCRQIIRHRPRRLIMFEMTESALFAIDSELQVLAAEQALNVELVAELGSLVDEATTRRLFERWQPQSVFHAAAYKHVPLVEANTIAGVRNNVIGTINAATAAKRAGVNHFVLVSTDKAVRPTNVMGASKRICELILQALADTSPGTVFSMVRFGNVLGSSGSVVPQFERQIAKGGPITVTHRDVTRFFMTIPEAAELVIQAGAMARGGEVYLLEMGEPVRIFELAKTMIHLAGLSLRDAAHPDADIEIVEIGLRPGEKLFEELLISAEARPTDHPRILMADEVKLGWDELSVVLDRLRGFLDSGDAASVRGVLRQLVAGYTDEQSPIPARQAELLPVVRDCQPVAAGARARVPAKLARRVGS